MPPFVLAMLVVVVLCMVRFEIRDQIMTSLQLPGMREHKLVKSFERAYLSLGIIPRPTPNGTTSANTGIRMGIPGIGVGRSVRMGNHSLNEWTEPKTMIPGVKAMILALEEFVDHEKPHIQYIKKPPSGLCPGGLP